MATLDCYKACDRCGAGCDLLAYNENEPCYGEVGLLGEIEYDDDYVWVHGCEGHSDDSWQRPYKPKVTR